MSLNEFNIENAIKKKVLVVTRVVPNICPVFVSGPISSWPQIILPNYKTRPNYIHIYNIYFLLLVIRISVFQQTYWPEIRSPANLLVEYQAAKLVSSTTLVVTKNVIIEGGGDI